jgi:hypothetical protein
MNKKIILIIFVTLLAFSFSVYQYAKEFQAEFTSAAGTKPANGHLWSEMECDSSGLCVDSTNGRVGIKTSTPSKELEVKGSGLFTEDVCNGAGACLSQINGFIGSQPIAGGTSHDRGMCTVAGGTLIPETTLANPICRFDRSTCPSGWTQYDNWSTTTPTAITSGASITCNGFTCSCPAATGSSGSHSFSNATVEARGTFAAIYWNTTCTCGATYPSTVSQACYIDNGMYRGVQVGGLSYATITQIGCY